MRAKRTRAVEREFFVRAPPSKVFKAVSTPSGLERWMTESAKLELRVGTDYELIFQGAGPMPAVSFGTAQVACSPYPGRGRGSPSRGRSSRSR